MNALWVKYLPHLLHSKLDGRRDLQAVIGNTFWLLADKVLRMAVGLLSGVLVARYLGPQQLGQMNFAIAIVAIFSGIASLGLNGVVVRDLLTTPDNSNVTLGTSFLLQLIGGIIALLLSVEAIHVVRFGDTLARNMVIVFGSVMILKSTEVIKYWFESQVKSRYAVLVENSAYLISVVIRMLLIAINAPLIAFAYTYCVEGIITAFGYTAIYTMRGGKLIQWNFKLHRAKALLIDSWPLLISGSLVLVNMSIDKVMLGQLTNAREVGIYSVANTFVTFFYFVPVAIIGSVAPKLIKTYSIDLAAYENLAKKIYKYFGGGALVIASILSLFSNQLITLLYGEHFKDSALILAITAWAVVFVFQVSFRGRLLVIESEQIYITLLIVLGTLSNVVLNFVLIPPYGSIGAAISYSVAWGMSAILFPFIFKKTRHHAMWSLGINASAVRQVRIN